MRSCHRHPKRGTRRTGIDHIPHEKEPLRSGFELGERPGQFAWSMFEAARSSSTRISGATFEQRA